MGPKIAGPNVEFMFNSLRNMQKIDFGEAPRWRTVNPGLAWSATCRNPICEAYDKLVYCNSNFGKFNVAKEVNKLKCPECLQTASRATNLGFFNCRWSFEGKPSGSEHERNERGVADTHHFCTFEDGVEIKWEWIELQVDPL
mmetsp:Transcript_34374/g.60246  ORF Transcript_34374/g.60246 Transcript_34374/m.60246 type:complete len:142 (+) Transcript_34374:863-1288(+)